MLVYVLTVFILSSYLQCFSETISVPEMYLLNSTDNQTDLDSALNLVCVYFAESSVPVKCVRVFAYFLLMLISLFGNLAVITIVSRNKRMWTTTNFLIANMAASDLFISVFAIPRELVEIVVGYRRWLLGGTVGLIVCKFVYFFQDISTAVSLQSLVVIAFDRYRGVVFPFRPPIKSSKVCKVIIPIIWIVAMGLHGTYFYTARLVMRDNKWYSTFSWEPKFEDRPTQEKYFLFISIVLIFLPLCVILAFYALIVIALRRTKLAVNGASELRRQRQKEDTAIVKRILILVFIFIFCITPITVSAFLFYFMWDWRLPCRMDKLFLAARFIFYSNASLNPFAYIILNERYRQGLKKLLNFLYSRRANLAHANDIQMNAL